MYFLRSTSPGWILRSNTCSLLSVNTRPLSSVSKMGKRNMSSMLVEVTTRPHWLTGPVGCIPDLLLYLSAADGFGPMGVERVTRTGHIGMQPVPKEFLDDRDRAVIRLGDFPQVGESSAWQCPSSQGQGRDS